MKKNVYVDKWSKEEKKSVKSFTEEIKWKAISYYGGPKESGEYLTSKGNGEITKLYYANHKGSKDLVEEYLENRRDSVIIWSDTSDSLTAEEILNLWGEYRLWYDVDHYDVGDGFVETTYTIYRGDDIPKYFLEVNFTGPIDSEIDTYEEIIEEVIE